MSNTLEKPCIILDITERSSWQDLSFPQSPSSDPREPDYCSKRIPEDRRATVLHPNRRVAETEALRLNAANLEHRYAVFEVVSLVQAVQIPTHVNIHGTVMQSRYVPSLMAVEMVEEVPF